MKKQSVIKPATKALQCGSGKELFSIDLHHKYLFFRRTRIVATIGPATSSPAMIRTLIAGGLNVARINFSHGNHEEHLKVIRTIRKISAELRKTVVIVGDLCGPKIRVGEFKGGSILLKDNAVINITAEKRLGDETTVPSQYKRIISETSVGARILLDDGNLELKVVSKTDKTLKAKVLRGGMLKDHKGMNLPDTVMKISALTEKDKADLGCCIKGGVDYVALSFVRTGADVAELKDLLYRSKSDIGVIAKIEKPEALENIDEIVSLADGIMVARGDLGVELPAKKVPLIQNKLIEIANLHNKPVIVATQMLESMIEHSRPTRAEVTDVAAACLAGADAVMLSAETASGKYPLETFEMMDSILRETEAYQFFARGGLFKGTAHCRDSHLQNAVSTAIAQLSRDLMVRCVFVPSLSGATASAISSDRPAAPIFALTSSEKVCRKLELLWGVFSHLTDKKLKDDDYVAYGEALLKKMGLAKQGDFILMLSKIGKAGADTKAITIHKIS
ncbi:MAG: pyruvate kinase [Nitrospirae bacterium]|nr:MAG: pyruvate kinase [Nitrospirota bacterium]